MKVVSVYHATRYEIRTPGIPPPGTGFIMGNMASAPLLDVSGKTITVSLSCRYDQHEAF